MKKALLCYGIATILIVTSFFLPPLGIIDNSVLMASGILIAGYQMLFGHNIKTIRLSKEGLEIETHETK